MTEPPVGVVGVGVMGIGIVQCLVAAGYPVLATDRDPAVLAGAAGRLRDGLRLARLVGGPRVVIQDGLDRVRWTDRLADLADTGFVIECVRERVADKHAVFAELDAVCPAETVFATCTSAIPVARLASVTGRPDRMLGLHFMNPAPLKPVVEVVRAAATSEHTMAVAAGLLDRLGKTALVVGDAPGFVTNRVLMLTINEAITVVHQGTATAAQVDEVFRSCFGHPMGPLHTADLIGLDTVLDSLNVLREHTEDPRFAPCPLLTELVTAGRTGRKTGRGFFDYVNRRGA